MAAARYTFEEATWAGAEVWRWVGVEGTMIGRAGFVTDTTVEVRLDNGRSRTFSTPAAALAWVATAAAD